MIKYFPIKPEIDKQIEEIKKTLFLSMNGISSDRMKDAGMDYKQNYGLSLPLIKKIASKYKPNTTLAISLWALKIRETMIMASLLYPKKEFSKEQLHLWLADINTMELSQQCSLNLFSHLEYIREEVIAWMIADNIYVKASGFQTASRIANQLSDTKKQQIVDLIINDEKQNNFHLYHSKSVCLRYFCKSSKEWSEKIRTALKPFASSAHLFDRYIFEEIETEVVYSTS